MSKDTKQDYDAVVEGVPYQRVNLAKYDENESNWVDLESLITHPTFDFLDMLFLKLTGREVEEKDKKLLMKTLLAFSFGTGSNPPSVMVPRLIASVTKDRSFALINGLSSGALALGTHHLGAVVDSMHTYETIREDYIRVKEQRELKLEEYVEDYVIDALERRNIIKGFGHPVYGVDPRPIPLLEHIKKTYDGNIYYGIYEGLSKSLKEHKNIHPNIDGALAVAYLSMGFEPEHGIYLSYISRSLSMVSHILEEYERKPFSFMNEKVDLSKKKER